MLKNYIFLIVFNTFEYIREHNLEELGMRINSFKKYNNIKVDWYITTDLPDLAHYFFRDFKSDTINLIFRGFKTHNNFYFDKISNTYLDNNELEITCDNKLTYWQYFSGCSNKTLTAIDILAFLKSPNDILAIKGEIRHIDENNSHSIVAPNAGFLWIKCIDETKIN